MPDRVVTPADLIDKYGSDERFGMVLFTLDESTYARELAPLAGHYPAVRLGPPWWFHDSIEGMRRYRDQGWRVIGMSWQPEVADGVRTPDDVDAVLARMRARLHLDMDTLYCPHGAGPPVCWCRKPLPGLAVLAIERHQLDPSRCLFVGDGPHDPGFARRLGFGYRAAPSFFAAGG